MRRFGLAALVVAALSGSTPTLATAAEGNGAPAPPSPTGTAAASRGTVDVSVRVRHFFATTAGTGASGTATATLTPLGQRPTTVAEHVTLAASSSGKCTILTLTLETLELKLLGLDVNLQKVVLTVTGERRGGVLGSLFCSLARAKAKVARAHVVAHLNEALRRSGPLRPIGFTTAIRGQAAQAPVPTCPILNLVLGPLHLDLLGLVVDLNQVHLTVVAEPTGGVLGSLFCGLANTKI